MVCALHDQLASLGRHAQLTRCFSAVAELLVGFETKIWLSFSARVTIEGRRGLPAQKFRSPCDNTAKRVDLYTCRSLLSPGSHSWITKAERSYIMNGASCVRVEVRTRTNGRLTRFLFSSPELFETTLTEYGSPEVT